MIALAPQRLLAPMLGGLAGAAWLSLWVWQQSPYGRYIDHGATPTLELCGGALSIPLQFAVYALGWTLMTTAMMLPTTLPLLNAFQRLTAARPRRTRLLSLVIAGYLLVWLAFGVAAHAFDHGLHVAAEGSVWIRHHAWLLGAATLLLAGGFQFTRLKYQCLDQCRTPVSFVLQHWRGGNEQRQALLLGLHHGAFCVGCCWALMLLMFVVGSGSLGWMLLLGVVMAIEKNASWGRRLSAPLGIALLAWGSAIILLR